MDEDLFFYPKANKCRTKSYLLLPVSSKSVGYVGIIFSVPSARVKKIIKVIFSEMSN